MPIRRSPNDARHPRPQGGRDHPEQVVAINRNDWSQSIGTPGRDHPVRASIPKWLLLCLLAVLVKTGTRALGQCPMTTHTAA